MPRYQITVGLDDEVTSDSLAAAAARVVGDPEFRGMRANVTVSPLEASDADPDAPGIQTGRWRVTFTVDAPADVPIDKVAVIVLSAVAASQSWLFKSPYLIASETVAAAMQAMDEVIDDPDAFVAPAIEYGRKKVKEVTGGGTPGGAVVLLILLLLAGRK